MDSHLWEVAREMVRGEGKHLPGHLPGHYVTDNGELKPIRPPKNRQPELVYKGRPLMRISIDSLADADGDIGTAETHDPEIERERAAQFTASLSSGEDEVKVIPEVGEECNTEMQPGSSSGDQESDSCEVSSDEDSED